MKTPNMLTSVKTSAASSRPKTPKQGRPKTPKKGRPNRRGALALRNAGAIAVALSMVGIAGCSLRHPLTNYERPDLFHPAAEIVREDITTETPSDTSGPDLELQLVLPQSNLRVSNTPYTLEVGDNCATGRTPTVLTFPSGLAGAVTQVASTNRYQFPLTTQGLLPSQQVELVVRSCQIKNESDDAAEKAGLLRREWLTVEGVPSNFAVKFPAEELTANSGTHIVLVQDTCVSPAKPTVQTNAPAAVSIPDQEGSLFKYKIDTKLLKSPSDFTMTVTSCQASALTESEATKRELTRTQTVRVGYKKITTTFNVMSQGDVAEEFGVAFSQIFTVATVDFQNTNPQTILIYGASLTAEVRFLAAKEDVKKLLFDSNDKTAPSAHKLQGRAWEDTTALEALDFREDYRPMSFSDVLGIFTYRKQSDPRQRVVEGMKSVGKLAAGAAVFFTGRDYAEGVSVFTGVVTPEVERMLLWDVLLHLKNLEQRSLKEVEELPPNTNLQKVVFFPRRGIEGILPSLPVYIAEIRPGEVPVTGVLIEKQGTVLGEKGTQQ